jgi:hypothetical protein
MSELALVISKSQLERLGNAAMGGRTDAMARQLQSDFPEELGLMEAPILNARVRLLVDRMYGYGFRDAAIVYRLVAWGVFLGHDYLEQLCDGELSRIARLDAPQGERFQRIRALITSPGYADERAGFGEDTASAR